MKLMDIINKLCENGHRGMGTKELAKAMDWLEQTLKVDNGVETSRQDIRVAKTYVPFMMMVMLPLSILMFLRTPYFVLAPLALYLSLELWLFFDWRGPQLQRMFGRVKGHNLIAKKGQGESLLILMAHVDSAPASFAYRPTQVASFVYSVWIALFFTSLAAIIQVFGVVMGFDLIPKEVTTTIGILLLIVLLFTLIDYITKGFVPGANDNGTGVATSIKAAEALWQNMPKNSEVWLVLTTGEEAGMLGAYQFWKEYGDELKKRKAKLLNIDTVGNGKLKIVTKSGFLTHIKYENALTKAARALIDEGAFSHIGEHHHKVGEFDSAWMARGGLDVLTLAAYDEDGLMPYIHTPDDVIEHVHIATMQQAAIFAEALMVKSTETDGEFN